MDEYCRVEAEAASDSDEETGDAETECVDRDETTARTRNHAHQICVHTHNAAADSLRDEEKPEAKAETEIDRADHAEIERADVSDIGIVAKEADP